MSYYKLSSQLVDSGEVVLYVIDSYDMCLKQSRCHREGLGA